MSGARVLVIGVDGLDHDVVRSLGRDRIPVLYDLVIESEPHTSTLPPDSVPSWTTIVTGIAPEEHGQLHNSDFMLGAPRPVDASLTPFRSKCFWELGRPGDVAVINPFLAYPPWPPNGDGVMVSGPPFAEGVATAADPRSLLTGSSLPRMGGFAGIPKQRDLERFVNDTLNIGDAQFQYSLEQLASRRWDLFFHTNLTVDRIQHYAWRHFDETDPTYPGPGLAHLIPLAHSQLDSFLAEAMGLLRDGDCLAVVSDHGHGQRASIGVNFGELFRQEGLLLLHHGSLLRRTVERTKTATLAVAAACHVEESALWVARRLPGKAALKSGAVAGRAAEEGVSIPNVGGSNPFGGIHVGEAGELDRVLELMRSLTFDGRKVVRWCSAAEEVLPTRMNSSGVYPELLFELNPQFGPTWNYYGNIFSPIITHKIQSGGHTRRGVFATTGPVLTAPNDSVEVHAALEQLCAEI